MTKNKLLTLEDLAEKAERLRQKGRRVVLCHGVFDLIHAGHIRHLQRAREQGDELFVTITSDAHVNKGPGRPVFAAELRAEMLAALSCVDCVAINHKPTAINVIESVKPAVYVKGSDYRVFEKDLTGNILHEKNAVESHGGRVHYTDEITFSSSGLINEYLGVFPRETKDYLQCLKRTYTPDGIIEKIKGLSDLRVLVLGDAIIDEYHYTAPLGQTGKGNILAVKYESEEQFAGGALAAANHLAQFSNQVTVATALGTKPSYEEFIRGKLAPSVTTQFFYVENEPTIIKRRFVDPDMAKLFEVYFFKDGQMPRKLDEEICRWVAGVVRDFDVVVVPDFGNGFITQKMVEVLTQKAKFLAVNTQVNSGNRGYHVIHRYPRADFVSLNEPELRLASHNRHDPLEQVAEQVARRVGASWIAVTRGTKGAIMTELKTSQIHHVPALSTKVVDRIGAGDCFLSMAALCLGGRLSADLAVFVASVAAALDVQIVCNREPIQPASLFRYITTLLK